ncbi:TerD family protein [Streptomyces sp. NPDC004726]
MTNIPRGANTPVPTTTLKVVVAHPPTPAAPAGIDLVVGLLDAGGRSRPGRKDAVNYKATPHPSGAVRYIGKASGNGQLGVWVEVALAAVEPEIQKVMIIAVSGEIPFGSFPGLYIQALGPDGAPVVQYDVKDAADEVVYTLGEFYRRDGAWKFRAVGQGYAGYEELGADFSHRHAPQPSAPAEPPAPAPVPYPPAQGAQPPVFQPPPAPAPVAFQPPASAPGRTFAPGHGIVEPGVRAQERPPFAPPAQPYAHHPQAPHPGPGYSTPAAPGPQPDELPGPFARFPGFQPHTVRGHQDAKITIEAPLPPGPVILEISQRGDAWMTTYQLTRKHESGDMLTSSMAPDFHGRAAAVVPRGYPLRLKILADHDWAVTVRPVSAARLLGTATVHGDSYEVFAHTGPAMDLDVEFKGSQRGSHDIGGILSMRSMALDPDDVWYDEGHFGDVDHILTSAVAPFRQTVRLKSGPRLLAVRGEGPWSITPRPGV